MKPLLSFAVISLVACACAAPPALAQEVMMQNPGGVYMPQFFQLNGNCTAAIAPDKAFIIGGVSSSAVQPEDAIAQLDKQLAAMRSYVDENHGHLELLERVRTLKNPPPQNRVDNEPPFEVAQRLQADFPANAPVDAILQKLVELGLDRFGDDIVNNFNQRREAVVRFRITDFDPKMQAMQDSCTADAWTRWCKTVDASQCTSPKPPANLELAAFTVRSQESLLRPDGGVSMPWQFSYNRMQRAQPPQDLLGNVTVHLDGNIMLNYRTPPAPPKDDKP